MDANRPWRTQTEALGAFIRAQRRVADLSLREMATLTHVSNAYLSQIERGLHEPSLSVLRAVADALDVPLAALLTRAGVLDGAERGTEGAILGDPDLTEAQRFALLSVYRSFVPR